MSKVLAFYRQTEKHGYMSQFHNSQFIDREGNSFGSCEQWMMYQKAKLFEDDNIAKQILKESKLCFADHLQ